MTRRLRPEQRAVTGWVAGPFSQTERQWYAALADRVGHRLAPDYADAIINWRYGRPPDHILARWLQEYEDEKWTLDDRIRSRVEHKVDRFHKQEHMGFLRRLGKFGHAVMDEVAKNPGGMEQPVILKYVADGMNQGMMLHSTRRQEEQISMGGLTINIGNKPPPRKLRPKQVEQMIEGTFTEVPALASPRDDD